MEGKRFYRSIGLSLDTWRLVEQAKTSLVIRDVLGGYPSDSEVIGFLLRHGSIRTAQLDEKELESKAEKGILVR